MSEGPERSLVTLRRCHSERSEESRTGSSFQKTKASFFASLKMTCQLRLQTGNGWLGHPLPVIEPLGRRVMYTDRVAACKIRDRTVVGQFDVEAALCRHMAR